MKLQQLKYMIMMRYDLKDVEIGSKLQRNTVQNLSKIYLFNLI